MQISVEDAQGQLLELVRRAEAGEEVVLTHEGRVVAKLDPSVATKPSWPEMSPQERLRIIREIVAKVPRLADGGPDAARSQDFLYDENGLPA